MFANEAQRQQGGTNALLCRPALYRHAHHPQLARPPPASRHVSRAAMPRQGASRPLCALHSLQCGAATPAAAALAGLAYALAPRRRLSEQSDFIAHPLVSGIRHMPSRVVTVPPRIWPSVRAPAFSEWSTACVAVRDGADVLVASFLRLVLMAHGSQSAVVPLRGGHFCAIDVAPCASRFAVGVVTETHVKGAVVTLVQKAPHRPLSVHGLKPAATATRATPSGQTPARVCSLRFTRAHNAAWGGVSDVLLGGMSDGTVSVWDCRTRGRAVFALEVGDRGTPVSRVVDDDDENGAGSIFCAHLRDGQAAVSCFEPRMPLRNPIVQYMSSGGRSRLPKVDVHCGLVAASAGNCVDMWEVGGKAVGRLWFAEEVTDVKLGGWDANGAWAGGLWAQTHDGGFVVGGAGDLKRDVNDVDDSIG